jgi:hypothetical protein
MREKVYPRMQYGSGQTFRSKAEADMALGIMRAVRETLQWNADNRAYVIEWMKAGKPKATKSEAA